MLALDRAVRSGLRVARLMTLYDKASERVRFHGVPVAMMRAQAEALRSWLRREPRQPTCRTRTTVIDGHSSRAAY